MRLCANRDDDYSGYVNLILWINKHGRRHDVFLDGVLIRDVVEADDEAGYVVRLCRDDQGRLIIDGDDVRRERLIGKVKFA